MRESTTTPQFIPMFVGDHAGVLYPDGRIRMSAPSRIPRSEISEAVRTAQQMQRVIEARQEGC